MIEVRDLHKHFRVHAREPGLAAALASLFVRKHTLVRAVDGLSFTIGEGERVGFLGPNGAGKTTTLKVLAGLLKPTEGVARVLGFDPFDRDADLLRQITLVAGQKQQLLWDLPPAETFELNRAVYDVDRIAYKRTLDELCELLELGEVMRRPTRQLSLGERMKCELAASLVHGPRVLFLDEPTIGLDVSMQVLVRDFVRGYCERQRATLLLTSHDMNDVSALCPRIIVIDHGKLSYDGGVDELVIATRPEKRITLRLGQQASDEVLAALGQVVARTSATVTLQVPSRSVADVIGRALATLTVEDLTVENAPLEEVLRDVFRREKSAS